MSQSALSPDVSVVMGVHNGARRLRAAVDSVLAQEGVALSLVIVDDGSTDETPRFLAEYAASDPRIRVITQSNQGLTRALIRGCAEARGAFIARQDADDRSLPGRLAGQTAYLRAHPEVVLLSCAARYVGPADEELWVERRTDPPAEATARLRTDSQAGLRGISGHGSAMFRRTDYERAGGYRAQFFFAQDLDLWLRLTDFGMVAFLPEVLYEVHVHPAAISGRHFRQQAELTRLGMALRRLRENHGDERHLLERAARVGPGRRASDRRLEARGWYYVGRVLLAKGDRRGVAYMRQAVRRDPLHARAWFWLVLGSFRRTS